MINVSPIDKEFIKKFEADKTVQDFISLYGHKNKNGKVSLRTKSVSSPLAPIAELCEDWNEVIVPIDVSSLLSNSKSDLTSFDRAVLELQFLYGLRISEVLNITPSDISPQGLIKIRGLKGSESRIIYAVMFKAFWQLMRVNNWMIPKSYNRFYFYRLYKKKGIYEVFGNNSKKSVTHFLRYNYLLSLLQQNMKIEEIQLILGHKSIRSTIHYVENLKATKRTQKGC